MISYVKLKPVLVTELSVWKDTFTRLHEDIVKTEGICEPEYFGELKLFPWEHEIYNETNSKIFKSQPRGKIFEESIHRLETARYLKTTKCLNQRSMESPNVFLCDTAAELEKWFLRDQFWIQYLSTLDILQNTRRLIAINFYTNKV